MAGTRKLVGTTAEKAIRLSQISADILEETEIPYVLEAGKLLGIVRENRLLPWDTDMDLTISRDYEKQLLTVRYKFWVHEDYEGYLECHYGDWRAPVKEWKSSTNDLSVEKIFDKNKIVEE